MHKRISRPSPALALSMVAVFVAMGGTGYAAATINGKNIKKGTIAGSKLKNKAVTSAKIKNGAATSTKIKNGAVTSTKIKNGAVTSSKIENGAISGAKVDLSTLGKVPSAVAADTAAIAQAANTVKGSHGKLNVGDERTVLTHGPLSVIARCADTDANPANIELAFYIASTELGSWFASWQDGSLDFGPGTPLADREINSAGWLQDTAGGGFDYDNPADAAVSATAPSGAGFNAFPGGTVQFETGCNYAITANVTG